jgi:hypothetical protein
MHAPARQDPDQEERPEPTAKRAGPGPGATRLRRVDAAQCKQTREATGTLPIEHTFARGAVPLDRMIADAVNAA